MPSGKVAGVARHRSGTTRKTAARPQLLLERLRERREETADDRKDGLQFLVNWVGVDPEILQSRGAQQIKGAFGREDYGACHRFAQSGKVKSRLSQEAALAPSIGQND